MNAHSCAQELQQGFPEQIDVLWGRRRLMILEEILKITFVSVLQDNVVLAVLNVAAVKSNDIMPYAISMLLQALERLHFIVVEPLILLALVGLDDIAMG